MRKLIFGAITIGILLAIVLVNLGDEFNIPSGILNCIALIIGVVISAVLLLLSSRKRDD